VNKHTIKEIKHFFETYKTIDGKKVEITGVEGREAAYVAVKKGLQMYADKFSK
jgi:inorganic pyrophosphatase